MQMIHRTTVRPHDEDGRQAPAGRTAPADISPAPAPGTRDQVERWVNEGGSGDDAA